MKRDQGRYVRYASGLLMVVMATYGVWAKSLMAQKTLRPDLGCNRDNTGNPCMEIDRCWLIFICRTDIYRYPAVKSLTSGVRQ